MPTPRRLRSPAADVLREHLDAVRTEHEVRVAFPPEVEAEAAAAAQGGPSDGRQRRDATDLELVTLDPPGSTDLDQAVHLARRGTGYRVHYAIADTAAFVAPGGPLDAETHRRVMTIYCPDVRVPLHPTVLSEGAASLLPDQDRPSVLWTFDLDDAGTVVDVAVERAVVRSRAQLDYPQQQRLLDAGPGRDDFVALLAEIGERRAAIERARGGVSLGRPEQEVITEDDGRFGLALRLPLAVEDHNAQISLMTGMAAADLMIGAGVGVLRTMPSASPEDVAGLRRRALALGVAWPEGAAYGDVLAGLDAAVPGAAAFLDAATSLFRGAAWTAFDGPPPADPRHGAIAAPYAHVTAPLRRLVDRYGSEVCLAAHAGTPVPDWVRAALPEIGAEMDAGARRASAVDRACTDLVEAAVLSDRVGEVHDAVALDDRTVQLDHPAVVGRVEGGDLPAGQRVRVEVVTADVATRDVRFRLAAPAPA